MTVTAGNVHDSTPAVDLLAGHADDQIEPTMMGDCAYGTAETLGRLAEAGYDDVKAKVPPARGRDGRFGKDDFTVDLDAGEVTCPAGKVAVIRTGKDGSGRADFAGHCIACPLRENCTTSPSGLPAGLQVLSAPEFTYDAVSAKPIAGLQAVAAISLRSGDKGPSRSTDELLDLLERRYNLVQAVDMLRSLSHQGHQCCDPPGPRAGNSRPLDHA